MVYPLSYTVSYFLLTIINPHNDTLFQLNLAIAELDTYILLIKIYLIK